MRKIIRRIIFVFSLISFNLPTEGAVSSTIIARENDKQIERLKKWLEDNFPQTEIKILNFETNEAKNILSQLELEFIPAVVWENFTSLEGWEDLVKKFRLIVKDNYACLPQELMERLAVLELYKRKTIPKRLDIFSMSFCPYSKQAETRLINHIKRNNLDIDLKIHYLVKIKDGRLSALHGLKELNENRRRVIIQKYWPDKFLRYLLLHKNNSYRKAIRVLGIKYTQLKEKMDEADKLLLDDYQLAKELKIYASPTFLWQNKFLISNLEQLAMFSPFEKKIRIEEMDQNLQGKIQIVMFFSPKCHACHKVREKILPPIISKYKDLIEFVEYDIEEPQNFNYLLELEEKYGILEQGSIPKIFIGNNVLTGVNEIQNNLEKIILGYLGKGEIVTSLKREPKEEKISEKIINLFKTFTLGEILFAGLLDGINPCAFTTLIFFLSFLSFAGYYKREIFYIGTFFILSVFLTYFLLGLGLFKFILKMKIYRILAEIFYKGVGILVIVLALINLYEFYRFRKTKNFEDIKLKLPHALKWRIQSIIGKGYRKEEKEGKSVSIIKLILLSWVIGFIVSILESVCTGQVYLPTITFITKVSNLRIKAIFYLLVYNLMFIIPLVVIFILVLYGFTSERFSKFAQKHLAKIKLVTAIFFFSLFFLLWRLR